MSSLTSLMYISRSLIENAQERQAIASILDTSRRNNAREDVTGALLLDDGHFMQVLEGERALVDARYASIRCDQRHTDVQLVAQAPIAVRRFSQWSMAYLSHRKARLAFSSIGIDELRRIETHRAEEIIVAMVNLASASVE